MANGRLVGRYELASDAPGAIRRAIDRRLGRGVLVANVPAASGPGPLGAQGHHAMITSQLEHPHIVPILDVGREGLEWYVVMAELSQTTLADALQGTSDLELEPAALRLVAAQIADALAYAHTRGVVHGDVNADFVWLRHTKRGLTASLGGFGLAGLRGATLHPSDDVVALGHLLRGCLDDMEPASRDGDWVGLSTLAQRCMKGDLSVREIHLEATRGRPVDGSVPTEERLAEAQRLLMVGEYDRARASVDALVEADPRTLPTRSWGEVQLVAAQIAHHQGRLETSMKLCLAALDGVPVGEVPDLQARTAAWMAMVAISAGRLEVAEPWLQRARGFVELAEEPESRLAAAMVARGRGNLLLARGRPKDAARVFAESLAVLEAADQPWEHSIAEFNLAEAWVAAGEPARGVEMLEAAFDAKARLGDRWGLSQLHLLRARVAFGEDDLERTEAEGQRALRLADAIKAPSVLARVHALLAQVAVEQDNLGRAMPHAERATRWAHQAIEPVAQVGARLVHARIQLELGHLVECRQHVEGALRLGARVGLPHLAVEAFLLGADLAQIQGAHEDAEANFRGAAEVLVQSPHPILDLELRFAMRRADVGDESWEELVADARAVGAARLLRRVETERMKR